MRARFVHPAAPGRGRPKNVTILFAALMVAWLAGCSDQADGGSRRDDDHVIPAEGELRVSQRPNLQWKRYAAFEADLARALALPKDELCQELGRASCIQEAHLMPLGGHDPFATGLLRPADDPLATTPAVVDRVLLSACSKRATLDEEAGTDGAEVFERLDLSADTPPPDDARVQETVTDLYRRLLARDPNEEERRLVASLARDEDDNPVAAADFAALACFSIGTTTEFLFF